jgi:hypothetical protein
MGMNTGHLVRLYQSGLTAKQVGEQLGVSKKTVLKYLQRANVARRPARRVYSINEDYFKSVDDHWKAYWLGFMLADGSLSKYGLSITLQRRDHSHLEQMAIHMGFTGSVKKVTVKNTRTGKSHPASRLDIWSKRLVAPLIERGFIKFKKLGDIQICKIRKYLLPSILRGYFDGDGSITISGKNLRFSVCDSQEAVVNWYRDTLVAQLGVKPTKVFRRNNTSSIIHFTGNRQVPKIMRYLYKTSGPRLKRKYLRFIVLEKAHVPQRLPAEPL